MKQIAVCLFLSIGSALAVAMFAATVLAVLIGLAARAAGGPPDLDLNLEDKQARKAVVLTQMGCPPCARMKKDLAGKTFPFELEWGSTRDKKYAPVKAAPTTVKFVAGKEVERKTGYLSPDELKAWMAK